MRVNSFVYVRERSIFSGWIFGLKLASAFSVVFAPASGIRPSGLIASFTLLYDAR